MNASLLKELWDFLRIRKKWWLMPIVVLLLILGVLVFLTSNPTTSPFIYGLF